MGEGKCELKTALGYKKLSSNCLVLWRKLWGEAVVCGGRQEGGAVDCGERQEGEVSLVWGKARWAGERTRHWDPFTCQVVLFLYWLVSVMHLLNYIWLGNQGLGPPGFIY